MARPSRLEPPESRNTSALYPDARSLSELRDDTEPLELLRRDLKALKLERELETTPEMLVSSPWKQVHHLRDSVTAEIEVRSMPRGVNPRVKKETTDIQSKVGTVDNPILATHSLDISSQDEVLRMTTTVIPQQRVTPATTTSAATATIVRPPLAPRPKNLLPPTKSKDKLGKPVPKITTQPNYFQPIIIDTVEQGDYDEPIIVHSGSFVTNPMDNNEVESAFTHVQRPTKASALGFRVSQDILTSFGEIIASPCQNSRIVKSAYALSSDDKVRWPAELTVTNVLADALAARPVPGGPFIVADHVDLSQMGDADELEAEYKRLVGAIGLKIQKNATLPAIQSEGSESQEEGTDGQNSIADDSLEYPVTDDGTYNGDCDTSKDASIRVKLKPLEELRSKCMVVEISSDEHDVKPADIALKGAQSPFTPLNVSTDEDEHGRSIRIPVEGKASIRGPAMRRDPSEGREPPAARRRAVFVDPIPTASSEVESEDSDINDDSRSATESEREDSRFVATEPDKVEDDWLEADYPSIETLVAGYFGSTKSQITNEGGGVARGKADIRKRLFAKASGGCCLAF
jgi:hypothetical protein